MILRWVEEYGPNIALRLAWVNVLIITEVRAKDNLANVLSIAQCSVRLVESGSTVWPYRMLHRGLCASSSKHHVERDFDTCSSSSFGLTKRIDAEPVRSGVLQPALVAEVLHSSEVDKVKEAYDSVAVVRS